MNQSDTRWKQRFQNFEKALKYLEDAVNLPAPDIIQKGGLIQFFEMSFELAWKTVKDYLAEEGFNEIRTPREAIKKAFEIELITDGKNWLQALEDRNKSTYLYDEKMADELCTLVITKYFPLLIELEGKLHKKL